MEWESGPQGERQKGPNFTQENNFVLALYLKGHNSDGLLFCCIFQHTLVVCE